MAWVNGRGYQRACSYRHNAADAEMSVAFCLIKARQAECVLFVPVLTSRTAGYGPVCPVVWEGRPARGVPIPIGESCHLPLKIGTLHRLAAANKFLSSVAMGNPFLIARSKYEAS